MDAFRVLKSESELFFHRLAADQCRMKKKTHGSSQQFKKSSSFLQWTILEILRFDNFKLR